MNQMVNIVMLDTVFAVFVSKDNENALLITPCLHAVARVYGICQSLVVLMPLVIFLLLMVAVFVKKAQRDANPTLSPKLASMELGKWSKHVKPRISVSMVNANAFRVLSIALELMVL